MNELSLITEECFGRQGLRVSWRHMWERYVQRSTSLSRWFRVAIAVGCQTWWDLVDFRNAFYSYMGSDFIERPGPVSLHYLKSSGGFRKFPPGFRVSRYIHNPLWSPICDSTPHVRAIWILVSKDRILRHQLPWGGFTTLFDELRRFQKVSSRI